MVFVQENLKNKFQNFPLFRGSNEPLSGFFCKKKVNISKILESKTLLSQKMNCFVPFFAVYKRPFHYETPSTTCLFFILKPYDCPWRRMGHFQQLGWRPRAISITRRLSIRRVSVRSQFNIHGALGVESTSTFWRLHMGCLFWILETWQDLSIIEFENLVWNSLHKLVLWKERRANFDFMV